MYRKRVTLLVVHFGSGKTEIALNAALELGALSSPLAVADLDVVKPYFRSRSARAILDAAGIELLAPTGANIHADLPIIVPQIRSHLRQAHSRLIMDVGGGSTELLLLEGGKISYANNYRLGSLRMALTCGEHSGLARRTDAGRARSRPVVVPTT